MDYVEVLSLFAENRPGKLEAVLKVLTEEGINILGFSIVSVKDFGVIKLLVSDPDRAFEAYKKLGFAVAKIKALGVELEDRPRGLYEVVSKISGKGINIESALVYVAETRKKAYFVFEVERIEEAWQALQGENLRFLRQDMIPIQRQVSMALSGGRAPKV